VKSLMATARKRKQKSRRLGRVEMMDRQAFEAEELDVKIQIINELIPLGLMHVQELLQAELVQLAGEKHARRGPEVVGYRHGSNPGSVLIGGQRIGIHVPRVRNERGEVPLQSYQRLHRGDGTVNDGLLRRVLYGISCRNYEQAAELIPGAIGLSSSSVSRTFVEASTAQLRKFQERDLSDASYAAIFMDGKVFADTTMVVALGITMKGEKHFLGFVETDTENENAITTFLRSLLARGLEISQGLLVILDGSKGLRAAVRCAFAKRALVQRCMWHKRENVVSHLAKRDQATWRRRLQRAMDRPTYKEALAALEKLLEELDEINQSAAASLREGFEELLTLHRLGLFAKLGRSFKTTNCLENVNGLVEERVSKVDHWKNSSQRQRWLATVLLDVEPRLRRVMGLHHLPALREAIQRELKIGEHAAKRAKAA
jgi:putative transposase